MFMSMFEVSVQRKKSWDFRADTYSISACSHIFFGVVVVLD